MRAKRAPKPTTALRVAAYYRVSTEEQVEGYSLDAQQRAAHLYCEAHGWQIVAEYRDEGKSARTEDLTRRPAFEQMLTDAGFGSFDVVVVHKLDRFSRNLRVTLDTLDQLNRHDVAFVSISEQMDFTTPIGKVLLALLASFAQYYSDNLSAETRKGKAERKRQGYYNGLLPFGVTKDANGVPIPDPLTFPGLLLAYTSAASGMSDRQIAMELNAAGYRTSGNRGNNPFTKDTVRKIVTNRFYLGELPDGQGGWIPARHRPMLDEHLFNEAQAQRRANTKTAIRFRQSAPQRVHSLTGLAVCGRCGGPLHIKQTRQGRMRMYCYRGGQGAGCRQPSAFLDELEADISAWLDSFVLPEDVSRRALEAFAAQASGEDGAERRRRQIQTRLDRIRELYGWGDLSSEDYLTERDALAAELAALRSSGSASAVISMAAAFLRELPRAWQVASPEQRNDLLRACVQQVEVNDNRVVAILPRPDFVPLMAPRASAVDSHSGSDGGSVRGVNLFTPDFVPLGCPPREALRPASRRRIPATEWPVIVRRSLAGEALRSIAADYSVSHETIRSIVRDSQ